MTSRQRGGHVLEIRGKARADAALLGGRVDADKDEVRVLDALVDVRREEQVAPPALAHDVLQPRLVDRQLEVAAVPGVDARLVQVNDGHRDVRAFQRNNRARWAA